MTARIFSVVFGHEIVPYSSMCTNAYEIHDNDPLFEAMKDCIFNNTEYKTYLKSHPFAKRDIFLHGFFQQSDLFIALRKELLPFFTSDNKDSINYKVRVCDLVNTKGFSKPDEIVVHVRLDDFQEDTKSHILHPKLYLDTLRNEKKPVRIVCQKAKTYAEKLYLSLFEEVGAIFQTASVLEDFATLRDAECLISSNSTFSWCASFLGHHTKRFLPTIDSWENQKLEAIESTDVVLKTFYLSLKEFQRPVHLIPLAGEHFQTLCDVTVLTKEKLEYHEQLEKFVSSEKLLFLEDEWHEDNPLKMASIVFVYQDFAASKEHMSRICNYFSNIQLLVIHNGDTCVPFDCLEVFFTKFGSATIYLQNNIYDHPQIHSLPMGIQNRMWCQTDSSIFNSKEDIEAKYNLAVCSWFGSTHPIRKVLRDHLSRNRFDGLLLLDKVSPKEYKAYLVRSLYSFCPPGNAHDTHRLWETLYAKSIPIVLDDPFIQQLHKRFPSLHFIKLKSFQEPCQDILEKTLHQLDSLEIPPCLQYEYWKLLFSTYARDHA
jgi:hypothetical protein